MVEMKYTKREVVESFSIGNFELVFPYLSENIEWNIIGENKFDGKPSVIQNCIQTAEYFKSVQTNFTTQDIIETQNKIVIRGTAEFIREGKRVNFRGTLRNRKNNLFMKTNVRQIIQ